MNARSIEVKNTEMRKGLRVARLERGDGLIGVGMAVVDVAGRAHVAEVRLVICGEHSCVNGSGEFVTLRPRTCRMSRGFARLRDAYSFQLPLARIYAEDEDARIADRAGMLCGHVLEVHTRSESFPI